MTVREKKLLTILGITTILVGLGVGTYIVVQRLSTTEESVAPTAPVSRPSAAEWIGGESCGLSFTVVGATPTSTPSATATPTPTGTPTSTPTATATPTPSPTLPPNVTATPTSTPTPTVLVTATPTATPTATLAELPEAGISLPTLGAIGGGVVLILLGILLAL